MGLHCWTCYSQWVEETYGYLSDEYLDMAAGDFSATCMLPRDHDGPHVWTDDRDIVVRFTPPPGSTPDPGPEAD